MLLNTFIFVFRDTSLHSLKANFTEDQRTPVTFLSVFFIEHSPMKHLFILSNHRARDVPDLGARKWLNFISRESKEALFVIFPTHRKTWTIRSVPKRGQKFEYCKLLPTEWGGRQKDFAGISDVHDALYCHNGCFLAEAKSLEGADKLAGIALEN